MSTSTAQAAPLRRFALGAVLWGRGMDCALIGTASVNAVSARDLHEKLGVKRDFTTWVKQRLTQVMLTEDGDYVRSPEVVSEGRGGHNRLNYIITLDAAKHIAMLERTEVGKATRQYFIEVEKAAVEAAQGSPELRAEIAQAASLRWRRASRGGGTGGIEGRTVCGMPAQIFVAKSQASLRARRPSTRSRSTL